MTEIGPRFTLNLIKIFAGSFGGATLYENPHYQTPNAVSDGECATFDKLQKKKQFDVILRMKK